MVCKQKLDVSQYSKIKCCVILQENVCQRQTTYPKQELYRSKKQLEVEAFREQ